MSELGPRIKGAREEVKITQKALADAVGVAVRTIGRYENGRKVPDINVLHRIAKATGKDISFFTSPGSAVIELKRHVDYVLTDQNGSVRLRITFLIEGGETIERTISAT